MNVGDYVRLDRCQGINKIDEEDEIGTFYLEDVIGDEWGDETFRLDTNDVIKSSPSIIDLIEVGDILTIRDIFGNLSKVEIDENFKLLSGKIISIVTKEKFESMEYRIGE